MTLRKLILGTIAASIAMLLVAFVVPASTQVLNGPGGAYPSGDVFLESAWGCDLMMSEHRGLYCANQQPTKEAKAVETQECKGTLKTNHEGDLFFDVPPEGICIINKSDTAKVLGRCTLGQFCRVLGAVEDCKDSGECSEITNVFQIRIASDVRTEDNINKCFGEIAHSRLSTDAALKKCMNQHKFTWCPTCEVNEHSCEEDTHGSQYPECYRRNP
jgi:hypothetical protein